MEDDNFVGLWRRFASEFRWSERATTYPYGTEAVGVLVYDREGHMTVQIMRPHRPAFASGDMRNDTPKEVRAAFDRYLGYFGTYAINEAEGAITHRLRGGLFPNWAGYDQKRHYEFSGNRLTLTTEGRAGGGHNGHRRFGLRARSVR